MILESGQMTLIGDASAVEPLIQALKYNTYVFSPTRTVEALGRIGDARAVEPLIQALNNTIAPYAVKALGRFNDPRAVEPLSKILLYQRNEENKIVAAWTLGKLKDTRAVEPLIKDLNRSWESSDWVRGWSAWALGEIGDARAVKPLIEANREGDSFVQFNAKKALKKLGQPITSMA
jgi:HEAT repeat protein